ncbi:MAG: hypothetical protein LBB90_10720 [Tannerella sp.]|nr:hypothetical protein [Tannerella sp.]
MKYSIPVCLILGMSMFGSCDGIYDNIEKYAKEETIYADKLDGIIRTQIGYERVEIDLVKAGRIPASQFNMGKAKKTVIECEDFTEPDHRRVIDSICSWVNITGLTKLKNYQFTIYTEDEFGNRSLPLKTDARPYTAENRDALILPPPTVLASTTSAQIQWATGLSSVMCDVLGWSYNYVDKDGNTVSGSGEDDVPVFFVANVERDALVSVNVTTRLIPKIDEVRILDTVEFKFPVTVDTRVITSVIFLDKPIPNEYFTEPPTFVWIKTGEVTDYTLKISTDPAFPDDPDKTTLIPVGDVSSYTLTPEQYKALKRVSFYWTVVPTVTREGIVTQSRRFDKYLPTIALITPLPDEIFTENELPTFSWNKIVEAEGGYTLKISASPDFPDNPASSTDATTAIRVGDVDTYAIPQDYFETLKSLAPYWTVVPTAGEGAITQSRQFNKSFSNVADISPTFIEIPNGSKLANLSQLTIEGLLRPTGNHSGAGVFFGIDAYCIIRFDQNHSMTFIGYDMNKSEFWIFIDGNMRLKENSWNHIAVTFDVPAKTICFYLNGKLTKRQTDVPLFYPNDMIHLDVSSRPVSWNPCYIGKQTSGDNGAYYYPGDIREVRIWNVVRTQEEVAANMVSVDPKTTGLKAYWKFNEGIGKNIKDHSDSGISLTADGNLVWKNR